MNDKRAIASMLADKATNMIPEIVRDNEFPDTMNTRDATEAVNAIVLQDPTIISKRFWAGVWGIVGLVCGAVAVALSIPEAREALGPLAPVIAAGLASLASGVAGTSAFISKYTDPRPTR